MDFMYNDERGARRDVISRWGDALARRDDAEVDRLVQQSRIDRVWVVASEQLASMPEQSPAPDRFS